MSVLIFVASWCEPCQQLVPLLKPVVARYRQLDADFMFVFAHDTRDDALGFSKEYGIQPSILATDEALKAYKNPDLPTIYVGDRRGFMATRYKLAKAADVEALDAFLRTQTAL
jgi:thiol-disulfide isomerase/thioredoxin